MELVELAWHDCYGEITPPANVIEDIVVSSEGSLAKLISCARLAVIDSRDLHLVAEGIRTRHREPVTRGETTDLHPPSSAQG